MGECSFNLAGLQVQMNEQRLAAHVAQSVEHILGKDEVSGSIPLVGSIWVSLLLVRNLEEMLVR